jgi:type IV pilus assembly protein PilN
MIRVNLLAADRPTKKKKAAGGGGGGAPSAPGSVQAYLLLGLFTLGTIVLCAAVWWWQSNKIKALDTRIAAAEQRQRELQAIKAQVDALEKKRETFQRKVDLIERLKAEQSGPVHMLDEISKALPDFVWLAGLEQAGAVIRFNGQSSGLTSVADFISALQRTGWFPQVDLVSTSEASNIITYALQANFKNPEVAAKEAAAAAAAAARARPPAAPGAAPAPAAR